MIDKAICFNYNSIRRCISALSEKVISGVLLPLNKTVTSECFATLDGELNSRGNDFVVPVCVWR